MKYTSTRNARLSVEASHAIARGISAEGGLFVPCELPTVTPDWIRELAPLSYIERAVRVLALFLTDFSSEELIHAAEAAYSQGRFEDDRPAPLADLSDGRVVLELWHGPTCAFKDMALQLMPHLMAPAACRALDGKKMMILVATSGDTGKAALEGFCDAEGVKIAVFYPDAGVSPMQRLQMTTQKGENVEVFAIKGNFDSAQSEVKRIFTDPTVIGELARHDTVLSSANSINWGRLVPQIVYYFSAYADLLADGALAGGEEINFVVPTGNFGNILAGYYAKRMGLPVGRLVCASNRNDILADFLRSGVYDANRPFHTTLSPSMDILISSNLERLLFELCGRDDKTVADLMERLASARRYEVDGALSERMREIFWGGSVDDARCQREIRTVFERLGYLIDPHTAVAMGVCDDYRAATGDKRKCVVVSTASPYKFAAAVLEALGETRPKDEFEAAVLLSRRTATEIPAPVAALENAKIRFTRLLTPGEMPGAVAAFALK